MHNISDSFMRAMQQYGDLFDEDNFSIYSTQTRESNALADVCEGKSLVVPSCKFLPCG